MIQAVITMLRAAIFDLDGTLYDYASAHETGLRVLAAFCESALDLPPARFMELHDAIYRRQRARGGPASHSRLIRFQLVLELQEMLGEANVVIK